jgi:hypothetical protein
MGDGELLSYDGINFHKPIEEQLIKEIKRRTNLKKGGRQ